MSASSPAVEGDEQTASTLAAEPQTELDRKVRIAMKRARARDAHQVMQGLEDFELLLAMGQGTFGDVFLARQVSLERRVAMKLTDASPVEGALLARLDHPSIVKVHDQRRLPGGQTVIVMELVAGGSLKSFLREFREQGRPLDGSAFLMRLDERLAELGEAVPHESTGRQVLRGSTPEELAVHFVLDVAEALAHAHAAGITHCDVKPDNVLIDASGHAMLADFNVSVSEARPPHEVGGHVGGTIPYMAPEVLRAFIDHPPVYQAMPSSDVFSLGVLLWELLTGTRPFPETKRDAKSALLHRAHLPRMPAVGERWRRVHELALECMHEDPARRPSAASVAAQLRHWSNRRLVQYFVRPQSGVRRPIFLWPYLGMVPVAAIAVATAALSAWFARSLLVDHPSVLAAYERRIPGVIGVAVFLGFVVGAIIIGYLKHRPTGTELRHARLVQMAARRSQMVAATEAGTLCIAFLWAFIALLKYLAVRGEFPGEPLSLALEQFTVTVLFGVTCSALGYMVCISFIFDVFLPLVLQSTLEVPPTVEWITKTRRRVAVGLCAAAFMPSSSVAILASLGFGNSLGLALQVAIGAGAVIFAFWLVSLTARVFQVLEDAFSDIDQGRPLP